MRATKLAMAAGLVLCAGRAGLGEYALVEALDVHVDVTAALLVGPSVRLGFSPGQFADLLLGIFGLDVAGDDTATAPKEAPTKAGNGSQALTCPGPPATVVPDDTWKVTGAPSSSLGDTRCAWEQPAPGGER